MEQTKNLWLGLFKNLAFFAPIFLGLIIALALLPILNKLVKLKVPKGLAIFLIIFSLILFVGIVIVKMIPTLIFQLLSIVKNLNGLFNSNQLNVLLSNISDNIWLYISSGITFSYNLISNIILTLGAIVYFLKDMEQIKSWLLKKIKNKELFYKIEFNINNYFKGLLIIMFITFFEYNIIYLIIKHPQFLLLGMFASIANLIPQFGGLIVHILALLTSLTLGKVMFVKTIIAVFVLSILDGYVINPLVYGKTNKLHPLIIIITLLLGSVLFGFMGILLALPLTIIIITTYNYYTKD
ncbi:MAG: AI-2E family transporter [Candidatus Faecisoma sp.]|nr:AI-2E family transporter [Acholeplasma sp.]MDY2892997.1 AI-2E family transporter [Candidatus Faecisoma sp.]